MRPGATSPVLKPGGIVLSITLYLIFKRFGRIDVDGSHENTVISQGRRAQDDEERSNISHHMASPPTTS